jgi:membrane-associated protease RseP (regulator of RpoE activity)
MLISVFALLALSPSLPPQALPVVPQERSEARSERPGRLGVVLGAAEHGVGIQALMPGSPAANAGLRAGDRIVVVDGQQTLDFESVVNAVRARGALRMLSVVVERDLDVEFQNAQTESGESRPRLGVLLEPDARELRVAEVEAGTPAERAGVEAGDRLLSLDGVPTPNAQALREKMASLPIGSHARLTVAREFRARLAEAGEGEFAAPIPAVPGAGVSPLSPPNDREVAPSVPPTPAPPRALGEPRLDRQDARPGADSNRSRGKQRGHAAERQPGRGNAEGRVRGGAPARPEPPLARGQSQSPDAQAATRELTEALRGLRAELAELRREVAELRRELDRRRTE